MPSFILTENYYLQSLAEPVFEPQPLASLDASTFLDDLDILPFLACFPILEFLPNIVFTSCYQGFLPCNNIMAIFTNFIHFVIKILIEKKEQKLMMSSTYTLFVSFFKAYYFLSVFFVVFPATLVVVAGFFVEVVVLGFALFAFFSSA